MSQLPLVSVVIPAKNGASTIKKCLHSIQEQTHKNVEVILIDSASSDETLLIASQYDFVRTVRILSHDFNHGLTRNLGVSEAKGDFVLFTVQDAYANSNDWIETMLAHFLKDDEVIGVSGQQIVPHDPDKNPHEWFRPYSKPGIRVVQIVDPLHFKAITPTELHSLCGWDNVNAMYRKSALIKYPFDNVSFGEDMLWAKRVVLDGGKIIYDYSCRVNHYHHSTPDYAYKRTLTVLYYIYKNFGYLRTIKITPYEYLKIVYRNIKYNVSPSWIMFNWKKMLAVSKAYNDVKQHLELGEDALDSFHNRICGIPPQGKQNLRF